MLRHLIPFCCLFGLIGWCTLHPPGPTTHQPLAATPVASSSFDFEELTDRSFTLFLRVFKAEDEIEAWILPQDSAQYQLLTTFPICRKSGTLGPKRRQGDLQVPEGIYHIDRFNPNSSYHLSLGINYPNASDRIRGYKPKLGGDIFIHGACVTVGCLPITDPLIEQLYAVAEQARNKEIPVHIFPFRLDRDYATAKISDSPHRGFWEELIPIYRFFEDQKTLPQVTITDDGAYQIK